MKFITWKQRASDRQTSVSTERRLMNSDPRYPRPKQLSPGVKRLVDEECDAYDRLIIAENDAAADRRPRDKGRFVTVE